MKAFIWLACHVLAMSYRLQVRFLDTRNLDRRISVLLTSNCSSWPNKGIPWVLFQHFTVPMHESESSCQGRSVSTSQHSLGSAVSFSPSATSEVITTSSEVSEGMREPLLEHTRLGRELTDSQFSRVVCTVLSTAFLLQGWLGPTSPSAPRFIPGWPWLKSWTRFSQWVIVSLISEGIGMESLLCNSHSSTILHQGSLALSKDQVFLMLSNKLWTSNECQTGLNSVFKTKMEHVSASLVASLWLHHLSKLVFGPWIYKSRRVTPRDVYAF